MSRNTEEQDSAKSRGRPDGLPKGRSAQWEGRGQPFPGRRHLQLPFLWHHC